MSAEFDELAQASAGMLVGGLASESWQAARQWFAAVIGQERRLDATRARLIAAYGPDRNRVVQAETSAWATRLRDLMDDNSTVVQALRALVAIRVPQRPAAPAPPAYASPAYASPAYASPASAYRPPAPAYGPSAAPLAEQYHETQTMPAAGPSGGFPGRAYPGAGGAYPGTPPPAYGPVTPAGRKPGRSSGVLAAAIAVVVLAAAGVAGWRLDWPPALFGRASTTLQPLTWSATEGALPPDAVTGSASQYNTWLGGISCPDAATCVAAGTYTRTSKNTQAPLVETSEQGAWTPDKPALALPADADSSGGSWLNDVVCSSAASCLAVGAYQSGSQGSTGSTSGTGFESGLTETLSGTTWTPGLLPLPQAAGRDKQVIANGLACPSAGGCIIVATNFYANPTNGNRVEGHALIETQSGGTWTPTEAPLPADAASTGNQASLEFITCNGPGACTAVGQYTDASGSTQGLIETLANGTWTAARAPLPADAVTQHQDATLFGISCAASGACVAVGDYTGSGSTSQALIETLTNGSPGSVKAQSLHRQRGGELFGVTCTAPGSCVAIGEYFVAGGNQGLIATQAADGRWTQSEAPLPANAATASPSTYLYAVACPTTAHCVLVGSYTDSAKGGHVLIENGTAS
jgi:hypothetical protein